ncbi:MAG: POTRA domain-containing protein, partial [Planctomycetota bacterium]
MSKSYLSCFVLTVVLSLFWGGCAGPEATETTKETVRVRTGDASSSVHFVFADKRTYKDKKLLGILGFKKGDYIDAVLARVGREHLEEFYLKKGFAFVKVELDENRISEKEVIYTYRVTEGPRVKIKWVKFSGNKAAATKALKEVTRTSKKKWLLFAKDYSEERVSEDTRRLEDRYWDMGFLDYKIGATKDFSADRRKVRITFVIDEGPVYTVERVVLRGAQQIYGVDINGGLDEEGLRARLRLREGEVYRERRAKRDAKQLRKLYREHGFVDAEVELLKPEFVPDTSKVNVTIEISEGRQFRIGRIDITGNKETQDKVIRRVLDSYDFQPGKLYNGDVAPKEGGGQLEQEIR